MVPRGRALLLVRRAERDRGDGRGGRHPARDLFRTSRRAGGRATIAEERAVKHAVREPVGVEVTDVDLRDVGRAEASSSAILLAEHGVAVFPGQQVDDAGFVGVPAPVRRPGRSRRARRRSPGLPDLNVITNVGRTTPPRSTFHVDTSYLRVPPAYTALRAVQDPGAVAARRCSPTSIAPSRRCPTMVGPTRRAARSRTSSPARPRRRRRDVRPTTRSSASTRSRAAPRSTSHAEAVRGGERHARPRPRRWCGYLYAHSTRRTTRCGTVVPGRRRDVGQPVRAAPGRPSGVVGAA